MNLSNIAKHRIRLLFKKTEGRESENDLRQLDRLAILMLETKDNLVILDEDKRILKYAKKMIVMLEKKTIENLPVTSMDLDFTNISGSFIGLDFTKAPVLQQ